MPIGAHHVKRIGDLLERKAPVDRQRQLAGFDRRPQIGTHRAVDLAYLLRTARAKRNTDIVDAFERMQIEIEFALHAAEPADVDDAAQDRSCVEVLIGNGRGYLIDDEVDTLSVGCLLHLFGPGWIT